MADEAIEIVQAEDLGPPASRPAGFVPGGPGRVRGTRNKINVRVLSDLEKYLDEHPTASPLTRLAQISIDDVVDADGEKVRVPIAVQASASAKLAGLLFPAGSSVRIGDRINVDARSAQAASELAKNPGYRSMMEKMARLQAEAMLRSSGRFSDTHIIIQPGSQAQIEAAPAAGQEL